MSLSKCKECGTAVSSTAKACPKCGAVPPKKTSALSVVFAGAVGLVILVGIFKESPPQAAPAPKTAAQVADDAQFSNGLDRATVGLATLRRNMKNPDGFKLTDADLTDDGTVCFQYTATNSFNATLRGQAVLTRDMKVFVTSDQPGFAKVFNTHCAHKQARSLKSGLS